MVQSRTTNVLFAEPLVFEPEYSFNTSPQEPDAGEKSSDEALVRCINKLGRVDLDYMSRLSGLSKEDLVQELRHAIFQDPAVCFRKGCWSIDDGWMLRSQYLTGNIPEKLSIALMMDEKYDRRFTSNIEALSDLLPDKQPFDSIHVTLGAPWVPEDIYEDFIRDLLQFPITPKVTFNNLLGRWIMSSRSGYVSSVLNTITYGTEDMTALRIIELTMNGQTAKVFDERQHPDGRVERIPNRLKTLAVQEKAAAIRIAFANWVFADEDRRTRLQECFNDAFVGYRFHAYEGSILKLPGLNPEVRLHTAQKCEIEQTILSRNNRLIVGKTGSGKTYVMNITAHEQKRMELSKKIMVVVPNNVLRQTVDSHLHLYPNDPILAVYPKDFTPDRRMSTLEKIRDGDYTCIYIAYSSFDRIVMSKRYWVRQMTRRIKDLNASAACADNIAVKSRLTSEAKKLTKQLEKYVETAEDTPWLPFEQLGVTTLMVDEAHNYKNIELQSRAENIVGMHSRGSKKCIEMLEKTRSVDQVIFLTGTPLTNSLSDLFVLQTYLQSEDLRYRGIDTFDMWINTFGESETNYEIDVDGDGIRPMTRYSSFHNLTELMAMFSVVCDFNLMQEDNDGELPVFHGYDNICVPKSRAQTDYLRSLSHRVDQIRSHKVDSDVDNLLMVTTDGRKCALDMRLVVPGISADRNTAEMSEKTKVTACAEKVVQLYQEHPGTSQVVFSDIGTPKPGFNIYDSLKEALMARGIPEHEIAFIHDADTEAARVRFFRAMNAGVIRVAIGSTSKLGLGVNVQERLIALHHLSVPWRPADMVQREGRIIRRGNTCKEVFIFRYITEGSFDSYSWQLLESKQRFIASFLSGAADVRDQEDIADTVLSYAEVKALAIGNPLIKTRVETANLLERVRISSRRRQSQLAELQHIVADSQKAINNLTAQLNAIAADVSHYKQHRETISKAERIAFGEELLSAMSERRLSSMDRVFDNYQGFSVILPGDANRDKPYVYLQRHHGPKYRVEMDGDKPIGCSMRLDHVLDSLQDRISSMQNQITFTMQQQANAQADMDRGNPCLDEIAALAQKLNEIDQKLSEQGGIQQ